jgi:hypothetical protein
MSDKVFRVSKSGEWALGYDRLQWIVMRSHKMRPPFAPVGEPVGSPTGASTMPAGSDATQRN